MVIDLQDVDATLGDAVSRSQIRLLGSSSKHLSVNTTPHAQGVNDMDDEEIGGLPDEGSEDESDVDEGGEHQVEFLKAGKDPAEAFEAAKEPLNLVTLLIKFAVVLPPVQASGIGRHDRFHLQGKHQLSSVIAFVSAVHHHGAQPRRSARRPAAEQLAALRAVAGLAGGESET